MLHSAFNKRRNQSPYVMYIALLITRKIKISCYIAPPTNGQIKVYMLYSFVNRQENQRSYATQLYQQTKESKLICHITLLMSQKSKVHMLDRSVNRQKSQNYAPPTSEGITTKILHNCANRKKSESLQVTTLLQQVEESKLRCCTTLPTGRKVSL